MFTPLDMIRHKKTHEPPQFKCTYDECPKIFSSKSYLKTHCQAHHEITVAVYCPICNASYSTTRNLKRHISRQHSSTRFECEIEGCSHSTARKDYLVTHYRSHKDINEETRKSLLEKVKLLKGISW